MGWRGSVFDVSRYRSLVWVVGVLVMALTRTQTIYLADDFNRTPGTTIGGDWVERSGAWSIIDYVNGRRRMINAELVNNRICENTGTSVGKRFIQVRMHHAADQFPGIMARFDWNAGSINGYEIQIGPTGNGVALLKLVNGTQSIVDIDGNSNSLLDTVVQLYVEDSLQEAWANGLLLGGTDTTYNGQSGTIACRHGYSPLSGQGSGQWTDVIDTPDRILTVNGLPTGFECQVVNSSNQIVGSIVGPGTTVNLMRSGSILYDMEVGGWFLRVLNLLGQTIDQFTGDVDYNGVYAGEVYTFTHTPTFNPIPAFTGRELIIARSRLEWVDAAGHPHTYHSSDVPISEPDGTWTEDRILAFGDVQHSASDRSGAWQSTHARVEAADMRSDTDNPQLRGFLERPTGRTLRNAEYNLELNSHEGILDGDDWFLIFRGKVERWAGPPAMRQRIEAVHWLQQALRKKVLVKTIQEFFPAAPSLTRPRKVPLLLGRESDEPSQLAGAPVFVDDEAGRGGNGEPGPLSSYGDIGLDAPVNLVLALSAGNGTLQLGDQIGDTYYIFAVHRYTTGLGDPLPFLPDGESIAITANNDAIDATCDASVHVDYVATRFYICTRITGGIGVVVTASHYIETATPATGVRFTDVPALGSQAAIPITTGGVFAVNPFANLKRLARMTDGRTAPSIGAHLVSVGYPRPVRMASTPISGALEYEDYIAYGSSGHDWRFAFPTTQVNSNSDTINTFVWSEAGAAIVNGIPTPVGMIPPVYCGITFIDNGGVDGWGGFIISGRPGAAYYNGYFEDEDGNRIVIPDAHYVNGEIRAPGKGSWATDFGPDDYYTVNSHKFFMVFLRGYMLEAALSALGLATITEDELLPAVEGVGTLDATTDAEIVVTVDGNSGLDVIDVAAGSGNDLPLVAVINGSVIEVTLGTDGGGSADPGKNSASQVAQLISSLPGVVSAVATVGTDPTTVQNVPISGGVAEFLFVGNPWRGPFRVNADGLGIGPGAVIGEGVAESVIQDGYFLLGVILDNGPLVDPTATEENRLISASALLTAPQTFSDGVPRRDTASWSQATINAALVIPGGNDCSRWLAEDMTWEALLQEVLPSLFALLVPRLNGSVAIAVSNPNATPTITLNTLELIRDSVEFDDDDQEFANIQPYSYGHEYSIEGALTLTSESEEIDVDSQARNDEEKPAAILPLPWRTSALQAQQVAAMYLHERAYLQRTVSGSSGIHFVNRLLGEMVEIDHPELPGGPTGYEIRGMTIRPDLISTSILCVAQRALGAGSIPGIQGQETEEMAVIDAARLDLAAQGWGVYSGLAVTEDSGGASMDLDVAAGHMRNGSTNKGVLVTAGTVTVTTADATNPRIDLVVLSATGVKSVVAGTPAATPVPPSIPASSVVLAQISVPALDTTIGTAQIIDKRTFTRLVNVAVKAADESVTSSTALQNDDELLHTIGANETWVFRFQMLYTAAATTGRIKAAMVVPSGATVRWVNRGLTAAATTNAADIAIAVSSTSGTNNGFFAGAGATQISMWLEGYVTNGATPGVMQLQWAQQDSSGTATTVLAGSTGAFVPVTL